MTDENSENAPFLRYADQHLRPERPLIGPDRVVGRRGDRAYDAVGREEPGLRRPTVDEIEGDVAQRELVVELTAGRIKNRLLEDEREGRPQKKVLAALLRKGKDRLEEIAPAALVVGFGRFPSNSVKSKLFANWPTAEVGLASFSAISAASERSPARTNEGSINAAASRTSFSTVGFILISQQALSDNPALERESVSAPKVYIVGESEFLAPELLLENSVLFTEVIDRRVLLAGDPAGHRSDEDLPGVKYGRHPLIVVVSAANRELSR